MNERARQREEGKLDEKRYSFASRASNPTEFLDDQRRLRTLLSASSCWRMYRVTRSYRVTPRSTKECNSCGLERRFDNEGIDEYILRIYLCTCASVMADIILVGLGCIVRTSPVCAFSTRGTSYPPRESKRESWTRRTRAYYCLRYAFHRCLNASFLSRHDDDRKIRENGYPCPCWEGYTFSLSVKLPVVCFGNIFRFYLGSLLFKEIEKRNGIHARKKIESEGRRTIALSFLHCSTAYGKSHDQERKKKR